MRSLVRLTLTLILALAVCMAVVPTFRTEVLQSAGETIAAADTALKPHDERAMAADLLASDFESGAAGLLAISDLAHAQPTATVALLLPVSSKIEDEMARRGVKTPDISTDVLMQLGVPKTAIIKIPAGEAGTTESTAALADWARANPQKRVLVVVGASHGRRYRRALLRVWPKSAPAPTVATSPYGLFRVEDWWKTRTTLREGLFEFQKLVLDYATHPW
ncbi:MAG TPA: hypothetical protein VGG73_11355 [Vicinamibacterales bacterium]